MREYKIYKSNLWYGIYKKKEENGVMELWFLWPRNMWTLKKDFARIFYHIETAMSTLVLMKIKDGKDRQDAG